MPQRDAGGRFVSSGVVFIPNAGGLAEVLVSPSGPVVVDLVRRCLRVTAAAKELCPVDTGRLRSSIRFSLGVDEVGRFGQVGTDVEYAIYVHEGTSRMAARPFLRDALPAANG